MKNIILSCMLMLFATIASSQSFYSVTKTVETISEVSQQQLSVNNAWFRSSVTNNLIGDSDLSKNFESQSQIMYNVTLSDKFSLPIVSSLNLGLTDVVGVNELSFSALPFFVLETNTTSVFVVHGGLTYAFTPTTASNGVENESVRAFFGGEVSIPISAQELPLTLSVTPTFESVTGSGSSSFGVEATFVVPIAKGMGIIGEYNSSILDTSRFTVGVAINTAVGAF